MDTLEDRIAGTVHVPELSSPSRVKLSQYSGEDELPEVMRLIEKELSEPYHVYTYRYFVHQWYVNKSAKLTQAPAKLYCMWSF